MRRSNVWVRVHFCIFFFITNGVDKWQERIIKMNNSIRLKKNRKVLMRIIILQLQVASQPLDFVLDKVKQKRIEFNFYHTCTNMQVVQVMYKRHSLWPVGWQRNATVMHEHQCYPHIQNTQKVQLVSFRDARTTNSFFYAYKIVKALCHWKEIQVINVKWAAVHPALLDILYLTKQKQVQQVYITKQSYKFIR